MRSLTLHLKLLIAILVVLGISVTAYQIFVLGIPVTEDATDDLWNIDAKVEFVDTKFPSLILGLNYITNYTYSGNVQANHTVMLQLSLRTLGGTSVGQAVGRPTSN